MFLNDIPTCLNIIRSFIRMANSGTTSVLCQNLFCLHTEKSVYTQKSLCLHTEKSVYTQKSLSVYMQKSLSTHRKVSLSTHRKVSMKEKTRNLIFSIPI